MIWPLSGRGRAGSPARSGRLKRGLNIWSLKPVFDRLSIQQITCSEGICKIGKEGARLILLRPPFQTRIRGIYAIGGAISPAYIEIEEQGSFKERNTRT